MSEHAAADSRPSRVRHAVVLVCLLMAVLLYLDRFCVSIAQPYIAQDLNLSTFQMGLFFSAFFLTYALFQVPSGWMTDRFGSRIMLTVYVLAWSFFTAMMGLSYGFAMLIVMRAAYGLAQAGAYPTSASILSKWAPLGSRGTASSLVAVGGRIGGAIAPVLTAVLIVAFVPTSRPSLVAEGDLLDAGRLCAKLAPPNDAAESHAPDVARIWSLLETETRETVRDVAARHREVESQIGELEKQGGAYQRQWRFGSAREKFDAADALRISITPAERRVLVDALNRLVRSDDLYRPQDDAFIKATFERAAKKFTAAVDAGESLTAEQRERMNRLVLESVFPASLGKIYVNGWRPVMIVYGALGVLVAGAVWLVLRNRPEQHPSCNAAELRLIAAGRLETSQQPADRTDRIPWGPMLKSRSLWYHSIAQFATNIGWMFLPTWFPEYLKQEHGVGLTERGLMTSIPFLVGWVGMLAGGKLTDYFVRKVGLKWGRRIPWGGSRILGVFAFLSCLLFDSPWAATVAMSVVAMSTDLGTSAGWAFAQDVGGNNVGSVLGWGNMWGNLGRDLKWRAR
jgi:MFS transporter, ACS family, glucarate transporter